jgi:hypothetical protein
MEELQLIYVGSAGEVDGADVCELYFSTDAESAIGNGWEMGARDNVEPPDAEFIQRKFRLQAPGVEMGLLEGKYEDCYLDGVYGVTALAWEKINYAEADLTGLNERMLRFFYGQTLPQVLAQVQARGFSLVVQALTPQSQDPVQESETEEEESEEYPEVDDPF